MLNRLKEVFSKSALLRAVEAEEAPFMTNGEAAFHFAVKSGFIAGLKAMEEQSGGAFRVVGETVSEKFYKVEVNLPSWQRHPSDYERLVKKDTTLVTIEKRKGIFSDSYRLTMTTDVLWDEGYYDFCSGRDVQVYSLDVRQEKNACEVTLRSLGNRARNSGLFDKKPQESPAEKKPEVSSRKPREDFRFKL